MSRTYDSLESYHLQHIEDEGYHIGDTVWFSSSFVDEIHKGVIKSFDIHFEGEIQFNIEYEDISNWELSKDIWAADEKDRRGRCVYVESEKVFMYRVAKSEADVKVLLIRMYQTQISQKKSSIRYLMKKIKDLK